MITNWHGSQAAGNTVYKEHSNLDSLSGAMTLLSLHFGRAGQRWKKNMSRRNQGETPAKKGVPKPNTQNISLSPDNTNADWLSGRDKVASVGFFHLGRSGRRYRGDRSRRSRRPVRIVRAASGRTAPGRASSRLYIHFVCNRAA